jgi:hypothetical protein
MILGNSAKVSFSCRCLFVLQVQRADGAIVGHGTEHVHAQRLTKRGGAKAVNSFTIAGFGAIARCVYR